MHPSWQWLADNYGNLASLLGLVASILAWHQAALAKEAALAVRAQKSAHEFSKLAV